MSFKSSQMIDTAGIISRATIWTSCSFEIGEPSTMNRYSSGTSRMRFCLTRTRTLASEVAGPTSTDPSTRSSNKIFIRTVGAWLESISCCIRIAPLPQPLKQPVLALDGLCMLYTDSNVGSAISEIKATPATLFSASFFLVQHTPAQIFCDHAPGKQGKRSVD